MRGLSVILACCVAMCTNGAAVKPAVPIALLGTDEGVREVMKEAAGALEDAAAQAIEKVTDVVEEALPDVKKTILGTDDVMDDVSGLDDVMDDAPGAAADDVLDDGAPLLAAKADDVIDDIIPESADELVDDVRDKLPRSEDDVNVPGDSDDVRDDVRDDVQDDVNDDTAQEERRDEVLDNRDDISSESTGSSESIESESESFESDEGYDPVATFMGMVKEFKDDVGENFRDSEDNDRNDDRKEDPDDTFEDNFNTVMNELGGELKSIGITEDPEDFIEQTMDRREDAQEDAYSRLLDMTSSSSESRDDDYDHLLDDTVEDLFGDDNDGLLDIHQAKQRVSKPRHNYYGYAANMVNTMQANMAYDKAHNTGTCPLYPVSIDEDKVTITTQGGCSIVIKLKGATVESVQTDGDNLTERERVARSVEVSYSSERWD